MVWTEALALANAASNCYSPGPVATAPVVDSTQLPAADAVMLAVTGRTRYSRFDVVSATPSPPSTPCTPP